ncbi:Hypothetical predicted protein, partial [Paramuricea clavata]
MVEKRLHETESSEYDSNIDSERSVSDQDPDDNVEKTSCSHKVSGKERSDNQQDKKKRKKKYKTRYCKEWVNKFPFVKPCSQYVKDKEYKFFCSACNVNLFCSQGGINDVSTHSKSQKHKSNEKAATSSSLRQFLKKRDDPSIVVHPSIQAEVKMALMIVHHNTFFNLSDHLTPIIKSEFHGSAAAEKFSCGRTKTSAIVNCIGADFKIELVNYMKNSPFSIMIDGSNDNGIAKMYPITVAPAICFTMQQSMRLWFLQREDPLLYLMNEQMEVFMSKLASKFVKPLKSIDKFYDGVREFYSTAFAYCTKCDLINDPRPMDILEEEFLVYQRKPMLMINCQILV